MTWNSSWPLGTVSVRANQSTGQQNTSYIETNLGKVAVGTNVNTTRDHFWAVDPSLDGRHRYINSVGFTTGGPPGVPDDPLLGADMDTLLYPKETNSSVQWFHKNQDDDLNLYQVTPNQIKGTANITSTSTYTTLTAIPINVFGEVFMWKDGTTLSQSGTFITDGTICEGYSNVQRLNSGSDTVNIELRNTTSAGLGLQGRLRTASLSGNWNYIVWYRAI